MKSLVRDAYNGSIFHPLGWRQTMAVKQAAVIFGDSNQIAESMGIESLEKSSVEIHDLIASKPLVTTKELAQMFGVSLRGGLPRILTCHIPGDHKVFD